jgi:hypothetical protein
VKVLLKAIGRFIVVPFVFNELLADQLLALQLLPLWISLFVDFFSQSHQIVAGTFPNFIYFTVVCTFL